MKHKWWTKDGELKYWRLDKNNAARYNYLSVIFADEIKVKKEMKLCCNCIQVNKFFKRKLPKGFDKPEDCWATSATIVDKNNNCKLCGHNAFYVDMNSNEFRKFNIEVYNKQYNRLLEVYG